MKIKSACALVFALVAFGTQSTAHGAATAYPTMARLSHYLMPRDDEISLARSAAPKSISKDAAILVFTNAGYQGAVKGTNGFVCMVARSWSAGFGDPDFWNPKVRAPICYNATAAASQVPETIKRTEVALAGGSEFEIRDALEAAIKSGKLPLAKAGSVAYMMSKETYFSHHAGHWLPHLMFFVPETQPESWGAGLPGSPVLGVNNPDEHLTVFLVPLGRWSDGSEARAH